jgi:hypothetical protein
MQRILILRTPDVIPNRREAAVRNLLSACGPRQQVPHRVFDSVRNDIPAGSAGLFYATSFMRLFDEVF